MNSVNYIAIASDLPVDVDVPGDVLIVFQLPIGFLQVFNAALKVFNLLPIQLNLFF